MTNSKTAAKLSKTMIATLESIIKREARMMAVSLVQAAAADGKYPTLIAANLEGTLYVRITRGTGRALAARGLVEYADAKIFKGTARITAAGRAAVGCEWTLGA